MGKLRQITIAELFRDSRNKLAVSVKVPSAGGPLNKPHLPARDRKRFGIERPPLLLARVARSRGFDRVALWAAGAATAVSPVSLDANLFAAAAKRKCGDIDGALNYLEAAVPLDDDKKRAHWELGKLLLRLEREALASEAAKELRVQLASVLREASRSADISIALNARIALANLLHEFGEYAESERVAEQALQRRPDDGRALRAKVNSLLAQNRFDEACAIYRKLLAKEPANTEIERKFELLTELAGTAPPIPAPRRSAIASARQSFLIAVGSGIGDMLHTTPMIRNIARRTEGRLDVLVLADHSDSEFLMRNREYVNAVWPVTHEVLNRPYDTVFLTHSFGPTRFAFGAKRVRTSREWQRYRPGRVNETIFNLEAAKQVLGIDYDESDAEAYFVGELAYRRPAESLIGLHAGSKGGRWLSKRWPYFPELATRLIKRGFRVASFGTAGEYVEGTENRTGGNIEDMCRSMLECTHFVSNDSGPMHIASALRIPVLALFAPTDPTSHLPFCRTTVGLALDRVCAPCEVKDHAHFASGVCQCIHDVDVETVERKLLELISNSGRLPVRREMNVGARPRVSGETP